MSMIESQKSVEVEIDQKDFDESLDKIFIQVQNQGHSATGINQKIQESDNHAE